MGVGLGALKSAQEHTRTKTRAWPYGGDNKEKASEEWYILEGYGRRQAKLWVAEALLNRTASELSRLTHRPREEGTEAERGEVAARK